MNNRLINAASGVVENTLLSNNISCWEFGEEVGSIAYDEAGVNNLSIVGPLINQPGIIDKAYSFDGINDYAVKSSFSSDIYAASFWISPSSIITKTTAHQVLLDYRTSLTVQQRVTLGSSSGYAIDETFMLNYGTVGNYDRTYIRGDISAGWNLMLVNWNTTEGRYDIYMNGVLQTVYAGTYGHCPIFNISQQLLFGKRSDSQYYYSGLLAQSGLWSAPLPGNDILALHNDHNGLAFINWK